MAILTAAGLMAPAIEAAGYTGLQNALVTTAIGFGGLFFGHVNDSGFWIVTKYLGLSVGQGLRTWSVLTAVGSLVGFAITAGLFLFV